MRIDIEGRKKTRKQEYNYVLTSKIFELILESIL